LVGQAKKATQHLAGRATGTQHLAGGTIGTQHLAEQATQLVAGWASKVTQHLDGQANKTTDSARGRMSKQRDRRAKQFGDTAFGWTFFCWASRSKEQQLGSAANGSNS
jgi:hypothetical protein